MRAGSATKCASACAGGLGIAASERLRLMWIGAGLWHDTSFYQALEERLGAVFVWSMYLPFAGAQYIRELQGRPLRGAGEPHLLDERGAAPAALDERMDGQRGAAAAASMRP